MPRRTKPWPWSETFASGCWSNAPPPSPSEVLRATAAQARDRGEGRPYALSCIAIQAWGEALRSPELEGRTRTLYLAVRSSLSKLARRWRDEGTLASTADPEQVATVLMTLLPGLLVGRHLVTPVDADQLVGGPSSLALALGGAARA
ncbi:TetR family transcriptional regulator C-terminal domain-containing protein [Streptomyces sp. WM6378]|uniref:TetR family transcriptional regulator C-terminal domain-containing protein n=1 Tax=Streptomyces sp. WM6378 TaxID=1415557 RepID=UPI000D14BC4E|nr:TetR family transcriptional regulator C-terminal domain-containing protein [Streptomyces sp. WM6378]